MHEPASTTRAYRWRRWRRMWTARKHRLVRWFWLLVLLAGGLVLHLHVANQTVYVWTQIQTLREENWRLWWEIQALYALQAEREARLLAAQRLLRTAPREARRAEEPAEPAWRWPRPEEVVFLPAPQPAAALPSVPHLPPVPAQPRPLPEPYRVSLWRVVRLWWGKALGLPTPQPTQEETP